MTPPTLCLNSYLQWPCLISLSGDVHHCQDGCPMSQPSQRFTLRPRFTWAAGRNSRSPWRTCKAFFFFLSSLLLLSFQLSPLPSLAPVASLLVLIIHHRVRLDIGCFVPRTSCINCRINPEANTTRTPPGRGVQDLLSSNTYVSWFTQTLSGTQAVHILLGLLLAVRKLTLCYS